MNAKAQALGMAHTHYADPTGLSPENVSTARDLAVVVGAAAQYPLIREFSTTASHYVEAGPNGHLLAFNNTNNLVKNGQWDIQLSKTGYIREAGKCLVMLATIGSRPFVIVLLDSARQVHPRRGCDARAPLARDRRDTAAACRQAQREIREGERARLRHAAPVQVRTRLPRR